MFRLKFGLVILSSASAIVFCAYLGYLVRLTDMGYCHAAGRYLTDEEKIRLGVEDLLKRYPPSVIRTPVTPYGWRLDVPRNSIYYRDVNEFMSLNRDCCKVRSTEAYTEGATVTLIEKLTGTATNVIEVNYLVRFREKDKSEKSIKEVVHLHITNCGTPGKPWSPY